jgi:hypothetical protein
MEVSGQLHAPATLPPKERAPSHPLDKRLGGPQNGLDAMARKKKFPSLHLKGIKPWLSSL